MAVYDLNFDDSADKPRNLAQAIAGGLNKRRLNQMALQEKTLARMKTMAEIEEMQRKSQGYGQPVPKDYFRDPASGRLYPQDPYRGRGTTVNLPFNFNAGQQDTDSDQVYDDPSQADASGLQPGTVVMVINPTTGQPEPYEI